MSLALFVMMMMMIHKMEWEEDGQQIAQHLPEEEEAEEGCLGAALEAEGGKRTGAVSGLPARFRARTAEPKRAASKKGAATPSDKRADVSK